MSKYPILFEANETEFKTHGIGVLSDAMQCDVTEELNGIFELNMVYPASGKYLKELKNSRLIYADANRELGFQPFRICRVTKLLNGFVNVYAQHISYDLIGIQLPPFETLGTTDGLQKVKTYSTTQNDYFFSTTVISDENNTFSIETPKSVRSYLLGDKDSFLRAYGGEFTFDRFNVRHSTFRGSDKGFRVKYGVNLVDLNQEESIEKTYTGIFPYYKDEYMYMDLTESYDLMYPHEVDASNLSKKIMYADGAFAHTKIANVDMSPYFEIAPLSTNELKEIAEQYMKDNSIGVPNVSLDVRFESLRNSSEYSNVIFLEDVSIGDTIHVDFIKLGVSAAGRIKTIIYDSLRHKNKRVSVGDPKNNVADTLVSITNSVKGSETNVLGLSRSVAKINLLTNENAASVELLVETRENGQKAVKGSVLVEAINNQSTATISADKVNLNGYVTVNSLKAGGTTEIDGSRIKTGQIESKNFKDSYLELISYSFSVLPASTYDFKIDSTNYEFTTTKDIPFGGSIRFYKDSKKIESFNSASELLESVSAKQTPIPAGNYIPLDVSIYFSESGTKIDLEKGEIISPQFAIKEDGTAYFGGKFEANFGRVGPFQLSMRGLSGTSQSGCAVMLVDSWLYFSSDIHSVYDGSVSFSAGDILGDLGDQHIILIENTNGNKMEVKPTKASLIGQWKATPYKNPDKEISEIVTRQDLIDLGLITK